MESENDLDPWKGKLKIKRRRITGEETNLTKQLRIDHNLAEPICIELTSFLSAYIDVFDSSHEDMPVISPTHNCH